MRILLFCLIAVILSSATLAPRCAAEDKDTPLPIETRNFMRIKLMHSQKILEGLTTENFDLVTRHAQEMSLLSLESQWNVLRTEEYVNQSAEFRHAIERLVAAAKDKNLDAATLGYLDVTLKCIHCHRYVRDKNGRQAIGANLHSPAKDNPTARVALQRAP